MTSTLLPPVDDGAAGAASGPPEHARDARPPHRRGRLARPWRGPETDPAWARPALVGLLAATAVLYLWGLGASGWANTYYSGAVQAATKSWKALLFGSSDSSNFITVDKTPASLWVMALSARVFGLSAWSVLVPQALEGVASVGLLVATVKRWTAPTAALAAGAVLALTPVATLMFRFNNPDALLVLVLVAGAYATTRAIESGRTRWLVVAGAAVGIGFLAKELQAFLVRPGFALAYLVAGPRRLARRIGQLVAMGAALLVSAGWWIATVVLWPTASRPYIGGSQNNSFWNVLFGYNGFGRLTGSETGSVGGGGGPGGGQWGPTGIGRLFNTEFGGQASWLIPAALVLLGAALVLTARRPRTDRTRASLIVWGGWLLATGAAISFGAGIIHPYYTVALAPAIGALVGIGGWTCWQHRDSWLGRGALSAAVALSTWWAAVLLGRSPDWFPFLRTLVVLVGAATALVLLVPGLGRRMAVAATVTGLAVMLTGPAASSLSTAATAHGGALPSAGPAVVGARTGPGGIGGPGGARGFPGGPGGFAPPGASPTFGGTFTPPGRAGTMPGAGGPGSAGGLLGGTSVGSQLTKLLERDTGSHRWAAAAVGANTAASYHLASDEPVMAIGGFNGSDPAPTLAQFQAYVRAGDVHWFIAGGGRGGGGAGGPGGAGGGTSSAISSWVASHFTARTVDGVTVYDLTS
jgi:4-amino-4-deoxy-L-arabinose transferase-like glycosyltransferase